MHYIKKILNNLDKVSYLNGIIDDPWVSIILMKPTIKLHKE